MLNVAYKLGAALAVAEATGQEDPPEVRALLSKLIALKEPKQVKTPSTVARPGTGTDVTTNVSWGATRDFSTPVG